MNKILPLLICLLCLSLASASTSLADYYKYTDGKGVVTMTNKLESVPAKYRSSMKVIKEEVKKEPAPQQQVQQPEREGAEKGAGEVAAPAPATGIQGKFAELSERFVWFKPLVYVGAILGLFLCVVKVTSLLPSRLLAKVIYVAFSLGVFAFLYQTFLNNFLHTSKKVLNDASAVVKKSQVRQQSLPGDDGRPSANSK